MTRWLSALAAAALISATSAASHPSRAAFNRDPVWSPNGRQIAFASDRAGEGREAIYVMNRDGSGLRRISGMGLGKEDLAWSPAGKWIAYSAAPATIEVVSPDGRRHRHLADCCTSQPDFSPSGHKIVYVDIGTETVIHVMRANGSDASPVESPQDPGEALLAPTWSPSGRYLAFALGSTGDAPSQSSGLAIIPAMGGPRTTLLQGHSIWSTDWSPDGRKILLVENLTSSGDERRISVVNLRTRRLRDLGRRASLFWARWSPGGRKILFDDKGRIFVMNADGSHARAIVPHR